ncbi:uncharacterized protein [Blastocystis hominis]|uniref:Uncharacterized protein n=1 Tax=Blastocystis hominis TaxID=12968 RepID=D8M2W0_BLAHO|nr:uncharacterized protein [Blastocystis hominis]CBK22683.2 unnamed protein product [Blastocystis hominis]|eukprot:XP_012896731.1 uncharacterized protein [Blastocystis hominis]
MIDIIIILNFVCLFVNNCLVVSVDSMEHVISIRNYTELKLENIRLRNELAAQKEMYEHCIEEFRTLLQETNDLYISQIAELKKGNPIQTIPDSIPVGSKPLLPPAPVALAPPQEKREMEHPRPVRKTRSTAYVGSCIQEHSKRAPKSPQVSFTESSLRRVMVTSLQKNALEELLYISLQPRFSPETIPAVLSALLSCMQQSFSLLKTYEMAPMNQKVLLFSSLLYFVITRFPDLELENTCLEHLQEELNAELGQSFVHSKFDRFSPAFLATFLVLFDLCAFFDALPLFKLSLYAAFSRSGVFPLQLVNALFLHNRGTLDRLSDCDEAIQCIIGATLQRGTVEAPEFAELRGRSVWESWRERRWSVWWTERGTERTTRSM